MATDAAEEMPFWKHLEQLRGVLVRCLLILIFGFAIVYSYSEQVMTFLEGPLLRALPEGRRQLYFTGITDKFMVYFKVSLFGSLTVTAPLWLYQVWKFVAPALYLHERRYVLPFLALGTLGFFGGLAFGFFLVLPASYDFLLHFGGPSEIPLITMTEYFSLTLQLLLACGVLFELPVLLMLLAAIGIVTPAFLRHYRGHAFVALAFLAAILTPSPDAFTMLIVLVPLWLLYEISIWLVQWVIGRPHEGGQALESPPPA